MQEAWDTLLSQSEQQAQGSQVLEGWDKESHRGKEGRGNEEAEFELGPSNSRTCDLDSYSHRSIKT